MSAVKRFCHPPCHLHPQYPSCCPRGMNARMLMESWGLFCPRFLASSPGCFAAQLSAMVAHAVSHRTVGTFPSSQQTSGRHGCNISSQNYRQSYSTGVGVGSSAALIAKWQSLLEPRQPGSDPRAGPPPMPIEQMRQLMQDAIHGEQLETGHTAHSALQFSFASVCFHLALFWTKSGHPLKAPIH